MFAAPAGSSGNLALGGNDPKRNRSYVMYVISGGGYGGNPRGDGLSNGCSTIGISKTTPIEVMEQYYPVLFEEYSLHEGSGGAGNTAAASASITPSGCAAAMRASMVMDHGRTGPLGALGGADGGVNRVRIERGGETYVPPHLSKDQDIQLQPGDRICVSTPGAEVSATRSNAFRSVLRRMWHAAITRARRPSSCSALVLVPTGWSIPSALMSCENAADRRRQRTSADSSNCGDLY